MSHAITVLSPRDLPGCLRLAQDREWSREEDKWRLLFEVGTGYGVRDDAGELIGSAVLTRYGTEAAAVSMVLVARRHGGRGIGRALMTHVLAQAGDATVFLNATGYGRPLYEKLGFVQVGVTHTHTGHLAPTRVEPSTRPARPDDLPAIRRLDAQANGADRTDVLDRLPDFAERLHVLERHGRVTGYAGVWRNPDHAVVGPVIADDTDDAIALIVGLARETDGPLRLDLDGRHPQLRAWATQHGVTEWFTTDVMVHDGRPLPGDRERWFVPLMQALG